MTFVEQCTNPKSVSIILRGGTEHVVDELERAMNDALLVVGVVVEDKMLVPGGGAPEGGRLSDFGHMLPPWEAVNSWPS